MNGKQQNTKTVDDIQAQRENKLGNITEKDALKPKYKTRPNTSQVNDC